MTELTAGHTLPEFEPVREVFEENFARGLEVGASLCIYLDGERVVDLWGGHQDLDRTLPWTADTLVNVYSTTKGPAAIAFATLLDQQLIGYDVPVARFWPELSAGAEGLSVGDLLAHRGGLCGLDVPVAVRDLYDWPKMVGLLEQQLPLWAPGTASGYHAVTWGYLPGELTRRVAGQTLGERLSESLAGPIGADFFLGLPDAEMPRVAPLIGPNRARVRLERDGAPRSSPGPLHSIALTNPVIRPYQDASSPDWQRAEIAASNGHASARGVASIYAATIRPASGLLSQEALAALTEERVGLTDDLVLGHPIRRGAGCILNTDGMFGPAPGSWGHSGAGGSTGFADPDHRTAFAYVMNQMRDDEGQQSRARRLIDAYYACL